MESVGSSQAQTLTATATTSTFHKPPIHHISIPHLLAAICLLVALLSIPICMIISIFGSGTETTFFKLDGGLYAAVRENRPPTQCSINYVENALPRLSRVGFCKVYTPHAKDYRQIQIGKYFEIFPGRPYCYTITPIIEVAFDYPVVTPGKTNMSTFHGKKKLRRSYQVRMPLRRERFYFQPPQIALEDKSCQMLKYKSEERFPLYDEGKHFRVSHFVLAVAVLNISSCPTNAYESIPAIYSYEAQSCIFGVHPNRTVMAAVNCAIICDKKGGEFIYNRDDNSDGWYDSNKRTTGEYFSDKATGMAGGILCQHPKLERLFC